MFISGTSGHAAEDTQHKYPYMVDGHLLRLNFAKPIYQLNLQQGTGGTIAGSPVSGESGTQFNLSATSNNKYTFDGFSVTGAALTGSAGTYTNSDVTAKGNWTYHPSMVIKTLLSDGTIQNFPTLPQSANMAPTGSPISAMALPYNAMVGLYTDVYCSENQSANFMPAGPSASRQCTFTSYDNVPAGQNLVAIKSPIAVYEPNVGTHYFGARVNFNMTVSSHPDVHWSAWYGKDGNRQLTNTGTITYAQASSHVPTTASRYDPAEYSKRWYIIMPFSSDYLILERDKYFTVKMDVPWTLGAYDLSYNNSQGFNDSYISLSAGYGKME